jgi:radical SAM protein with 4Fe4S-binding SPASM domain
MAGPKTSAGLADLAAWIFGNGMMVTIHVVRNLDDSWDGGEARQEAYAAYCSQLADDFEAMFTRLESEEFQLRLPRWMEIAELSFDHPSPSVCCGIASDHIVIAQDGTLASCPMTVNEETVPMGDDVYASATRTFAPRPDERASDECLSCRWFRVCASACPVTNERVAGHAYTRSPLCAFWKYAIPRYLLFFGRKLRQAGASPDRAIWSGFAAR